MSWMPSLCGKQLIQSIKLYTISTTSLWDMFWRAAGLQLPVLLLWLSKWIFQRPVHAHFCWSYWNWCLYQKIFFMCSNCPMPCMCLILNSPLWYICSTCLRDVAFLWVLKYQNVLTVTLLRKKGISMMYITSTSRVTFPWCSRIPVVRSYISVLIWLVAFLVVLPCNEPILAPKCLMLSRCLLLC